jgi:hypothetical protein
MKRMGLILGMSVAIAAAPIALSAPPGTPADRPAAVVAKAVPKPAVKAKGNQGRVLLLVRACVTVDATEQPREVKATVLSSNAHARRGGLKRSTPFTAKLEGAKVTLVGKARKQSGTTAKLPRLGDWDSLVTGDVITLRVRADRTPRGTKPVQWDAKAFPSWASVVDSGPIRPRVCPPATA